MGTSKPQEMPAVVRLAHEVLAQIAAEVDASRLEELRKKLPAYALRAEKAGQEVTASSLRAAALDVRADFAAAAGDGAGGGKLALADYARIEREIKVERDNPWMAVFEKGDAEEYIRLRTARTEKPHNRETWDVMLRALAALPDPLPVLELLIADQYNQDVVKITEPHHPRQLLVRHLDRALKVPLLAQYAGRDPYFHSFLVEQGHYEALKKILAVAGIPLHQDFIVNTACAALRAGHKEALAEMMAQHPLLAENHKLAVTAAIKDEAALVAGYLDRIPDGMARTNALGQLITEAVGAASFNVLEVLKQRGVDMDEVMQRWVRGLPRMHAPQIDMMARLYKQGYWRIGGPAMFQRLFEEMRYAGNRTGLVMLETAAQHEGILKPRDRLTGEVPKHTMPSEEAQAEVTSWQLEALGKALQGEPQTAVAVYLATELLGYFNTHETAAEETYRDKLQARLRSIMMNRHSSHGAAGTLMRRAQGAGRESLGECVQGMKQLLGLYESVDKLLADAPQSEAADIVRMLCDSSCKSMAEPAMTSLMMSPIDLPSLTDLMRLAGPRMASIVEAGVRGMASNGNWRKINAIIDGGLLADMPNAMAHINAIPRAAGTMQAVRAWNRVLPDMDVKKPLLWQPVRHIRPALFRAVFDMLAGGRREDEAALRGAYNLCAVFRSEDRIMRYVERWGDTFKRGGRHILTELANAIVLPSDSGAIDPGAWGDALLQHGPEMGRYMKYADRIAAPLGSLNKMREVAAQYHYKRGGENPALAALCFRKGVSEDAHDEALALLAEKKALAKPRVQRIPDMKIDGAEFGMPGAKFYRLKDDDFRGLFLGLMVDCCQHIDKGQAAWCARHGFKSENGGFYVIETADGEIVGETWAWRGTGGQMVFDSLETLGKSMTDNTRVSKAQWSALMDRVKERLQAAPGDITALLVGTDGQRCPLLNYNVPDAPPAPYAKALAPALPLDHKSYADSREQYLFWHTEGYKDEPVPTPEGLEIKEWGPPGVPAQPVAAPAMAMAIAAGPAQAQPANEQAMRAAIEVQRRRFDHRDHMVWLDDGGLDPLVPPRWMPRGPRLLR